VKSRSLYVEERSAALRGERFCEHCLAIAWQPVQQKMVKVVCHTLQDSAAPGNTKHMSQNQATLTSFSPSPTHLLVKLAALMLKNVARLSVASAFASIVLPLPGGP
jgi:hypothetical protein